MNRMNSVCVNQNYSKPFRTNHRLELFGLKTRFGSLINFWLTFIKRDIKLQFRASIRMNPEKFQLILISFLIPFNLNHSHLELIWIGLDKKFVSDCFGWIWIDALDWSGMNRLNSFWVNQNYSKPFQTNQRLELCGLKTRFGPIRSWIDSTWFGLTLFENLAHIGLDLLGLVPQIDFWLTFIKRDIRLQFSASIRMNPKKSQLILISFLIRFNLNHSDLGFNGLVWMKNLVQIDLDEFGLMPRIEVEWIGLI